MLIFEGKEIETDTERLSQRKQPVGEPLAVVIAENEGDCAVARTLGSGAFCA